MTGVFKRACEETDSASGEKLPETMRRCLYLGELRPRAEMIRFVIGPEDAVVPDLSENLPGHGLWVTATAEAVRQAASKNLFAKAAKKPAKPSKTLADDVANLLKKRCLDLLGLAKGAGIAVLGETETETALRARKLALYLHASDAARALDNRQAVADCEIFSREEMGAALGYAQIVYAGLAPHGLTEKLKVEIKRFQSMTVLPISGKNEG